MMAVSVAPGTTWELQLTGELQLPPLVLVQVIVAARRSAATSNASSPAIRANFRHIIVLIPHRMGIVQRQNESAEPAVRLKWWRRLRLTFGTHKHKEIGRANE